MPVNIVRKPFAVDFVKNDLNFVFKGDNIQVAGTESSGIIFFGTQPLPGAKFTLKINDKSFYYTIISATQTNDSIYKLLHKNGKIDDDDLIAKLNANLYLSNNFTFDISYGSGIMRLSLKAKNPGENKISVTTDGSFNAFWSNLSLGIARKYRDNYKLFLRINYEYIKSGNKIIEQSPEILLDTDNNGYTTFPLEILKKLSEEIDIPSSFNQKFGTGILNRMLIKYAIEFSEMYGGEVKWLKRSNDFYAINGLNSASGASINRPDWNDVFYNTVENCQYIRLYGCDNNTEDVTHYEGRNYIYLCLFDKTKNESYTKTITGTIDWLLANGEIKTKTLQNLTLKNFSIVRVPVYISAFDIVDKNIVKYTVTLWNTDKISEKIKKTYIIKPKPYFFSEFLFQNKYGVLEYFYCEHKKIENSINGESMVYNSLVEYDIKEATKIFTVKTGSKHYNKLKLIEQAAKNLHNFVILKNKLIPISIIPESITTLNEAIDLQDISFKYRYKIEDTEEFVLQNFIEDTVIDPTHDTWQDHKEIGDTTINLTWAEYDEANYRNRGCNYRRWRYGDKTSFKFISICYQRIVCG